MSESAKFKSVRVKSRLAELMRLPGGIGREDALVAASKGIDALRDGCLKAIPVEIAALETMLAANRSGQVSAVEIEKLLDRAGRILTLSGTFDCMMLDAVVKRFCDLAIGMIENGITSVAPLSVHVRAMRLVCPGSQTLTDAEAGGVLNELLKIHAHFGFKGVTSVDETEDSAAVSAA